MNIPVTKRAGIRQILMKNPKALFVFDGGDAPGYMAVATALTESACRQGWEIFAAREGFRSLTGDGFQDGALVRLLWNEEDAWRLHARGGPAMALHRKINDPGCAFRSERFRGFSSGSKTECAARFVVAGGFDYLVGIGGNGTFEGIRAIAQRLEQESHTHQVRVGFINVSVDSDLLGDRSIGFATGVEEGARIARGLFDDAFTHQRIYILEMMGNRAGKHALHAGAAARAHLIVLPGFNLSDKVLQNISHQLDQSPYALVVVAEGYATPDERKSSNAAELLKKRLAAAGLADREGRRVIAEPFSRFLRGVGPCAMDVEMAVLKSQILVDGLNCGRDRVMAYALGEHVHGLRLFAEIETDNSVEPAYLNLVDRFGIPDYREYVGANFTAARK